MADDGRLTDCPEFTSGADGTPISDFNVGSKIGIFREGLWKIN